MRAGWLRSAAMLATGVVCLLGGHKAWATCTPSQIVILSDPLIANTGSMDMGSATAPTFYVGGNAGVITVAEEDSSGNICTDPNGIALAFTGGTTTLTNALVALSGSGVSETTVFGTSVTITPTYANGIATFDLSPLPLMGTTQYTFTFSAGAGTVGVTAATVSFTPASDTMYVVTELDDANATACTAYSSGTPATGCTLRGVLTQVGAGTSHYVMTFSNSWSTAQTITLASDLQGVTWRGTGTLDIAGPGPGNLTVLGSTSSAYGIFVEGTSAGNFTVSGLTLQNGKGTAQTHGGCLYLSTASSVFTLVNTVVNGCTSSNVPDALYVPTGGTETVNIFDSNFTNTANAVYVSGGSGAINIANSTFTAVTGSGAALSITPYGSASSQTPSVTIINSQISGNTSSANGAGISVASISASQTLSTNFTLVNDTISGNSCSTASYGCAISFNHGGGAATQPNYNLVMVNDTVSNNSYTASGSSYAAGLYYRYTNAAFINTVIEGNSVVTLNSSDASDVMGGTGNNAIVSTGSVINTTANTSTTVAQIGLSDLGSYGGPAQTMVPVPIASSPLLKEGSSIAAGQVMAVAITAVGTGYSAAPTLTFTNGNCTTGHLPTATATLTATPGGIANIKITSPGYGCTGTTTDATGTWFSITITCSGSCSGGSGATARAYILTIPKTDARGITYPTSGTNTVDAGAVQTKPSLAFTQQPQNVTQSTNFSPSPAVEYYDFGNPVPLTNSSYTSSNTPQITMSAASGTLSGTTGVYLSDASPAVATFSALTAPSGTSSGNTLTATTASGTYYSAVTATSSSFNVTGTYGAAAQLAFAPGGSPTTPVAAGNSSGTVTVNIEDTNGSVVANSTMTVYMQITGPAGYTTSCSAGVAAVNGVANFSSLPALTIVGAYSYTPYTTSNCLSSGSLTSPTAASESVTPGSPSQFIFSPAPVSTETAGASLSGITVTVEDAYGNLVNNLTSPPTLQLLSCTSSSGCTSSGTTTATAVVVASAGVATFTINAPSSPGTYYYTVSCSSGCTSSWAGISSAKTTTSAVTVGTASGTVMAILNSAFPLSSGAVTIYSGANPSVISVAEESSANGPIVAASNGICVTITYDSSNGSNTLGTYCANIGSKTGATANTLSQYVSASYNSSTNVYTFDFSQLPLYYYTASAGATLPYTFSFNDAGSASSVCTSGCAPYTAATFNVETLYGSSASGFLYIVDNFSSVGYSSGVCNDYHTTTAGTQPSMSGNGSCNFTSALHAVVANQASTNYGLAVIAFQNSAWQTSPTTPTTIAYNSTNAPTGWNTSTYQPKYGDWIAGPGPQNLILSGSGTYQVLGEGNTGTQSSFSVTGLTLADGYQSGSNLNGSGLMLTCTSGQACSDYIVNDDFINNNLVQTATGTAYGPGLGIGGSTSTGTFYVSDDQFIGNTSSCSSCSTGAVNGGGLGFNSTGNLLVTNSIFVGNSAFHEGGGISIQGASTATETYSINNSLFLNNTTGNGPGGGIFAVAGSGATAQPILIMNNDTLYGNTAYTTGGGLYVNTNGTTNPTVSIYVDLSNLSFVGNSAASGGGIYVNAYDSGVFVNSICEDNTASTSYADADLSATPSVYTSGMSFCNTGSSATPAKNTFASLGLSDPGLGVGSIAVEIPGSGYTNGTYSITLTGGGCSVAPTATATVAGNVITSIAVNGAGVNCTSVPAVPLSSVTGGSGGAAYVSSFIGSNGGISTSTMVPLPGSPAMMAGSSKYNNSQMGAYVTTVAGSDPSTTSCTAGTEIDFTGGGCSTEPVGKIVEGVGGTGTFGGIALTNPGAGCSGTPTIVTSGNTLAAACATPPTSTPTLVMQGNLTTDARGFARANSATGTNDIDVGAGQSKGLLTMTWTPTSTTDNTAYSTEPIITYTDNGFPLTTYSAPMAIQIFQSSTSGGTTGKGSALGTGGASAITNNTAGGTYTFAGLTTGTALETGVYLTAEVCVTSIATCGNYSTTDFASGGTEANTYGAAVSSSGTFNITVGAASKLAYTAGYQPAASITSGNTGGYGNSPAQIEVNEEDSGGNVITTDNSTSITLTISCSACSPSYSQTTRTATVSSGVATFSSLPTLTIPGTYSYVVSSGSLTQATASETVTAGTASQMVFGTAPSSSITAGSTSSQLTVKVEDAYGNTLTNDSSTTVYLQVSCSACSPAYTTTYKNVADSSGVATFLTSNLPTLTTAGSYTYTACSTSNCSGGLTQATASETVNPGTATSLSQSNNFASPVNNGTAYNVQVTAYDAYGNIATGYTGTVTVTSHTDSSEVVSPSSHTYGGGDAGVYTFSVTLNTAGSQSVTFGDGTYSVQVSGLTVNATIWVVNSNGTLSKLTSGGTADSTGSGYSGSGLSSGSSGGVAFDNSGHAWAVTSGSNTLAEVSSSGSSLNTLTNGGLDVPVAVTVDGNGHVWVANSGNSSVSQFTNGGTAVSGTNGITGNATGLSSPTGLAIDASGNVWVTNPTSVTQIVGSAGPVIVPTVKAINNNQLGVKP